MSERQSGGENKFMKTLAGLAALAGTVAGVEAKVIVPHNQENSDKLIQTSELGTVAGNVEMALEQRLADGQMADLQEYKDLESSTIMHGANPRLIPDQVHDTYSVGELTKVDENSPLHDNPVQLEQLPEPRLILAGEIDFASTSGLETSRLSAVGPDGKQLFTTVDKASVKMFMWNPTVKIENGGLAFIAYDQGEKTDVKVLITWSELAEAMNDTSENIHLTINGQPLKIELPNALNQVLVNNDHVGDHLTAIDMSPIPVATAEGDVTRFSQDIHNASKDAEAQILEKMLPFIFKVDSTEKYSGVQRIGRITMEDGIKASVFVNTSYADLS